MEQYDDVFEPYSPMSAAFETLDLTDMDIDNIGEAPSPLAFNNLYFLFTDDTENLPNIDELSEYIFSSMTAAEIEDVNNIGMLFENYFGEI